MKQTRRGFLKLLGKTAIVGTGFAIAPKAALAAIKPKKQLLNTGAAPGRWSGKIPMTATEVIARRKELTRKSVSIDDEFVRQYEKEVHRVFRQRGSFLKPGIRRK